MHVHLIRKRERELYSVHVICAIPQLKLRVSHCSVDNIFFYSSIQFASFIIFVKNEAFRHGRKLVHARATIHYIKFHIIYSICTFLYVEHVLWTSFSKALNLIWREWSGMCTAQYKWLQQCIWYRNHLIITFCLIKALNIERERKKE